jgi:hypothetical protein
MATVCSHVKTVASDRPPRSRPGSWSSARKRMRECETALDTNSGHGQAGRCRAVRRRKGRSGSGHLRISMVGNCLWWSSVDCSPRTPAAACPRRRGCSSHGQEPMWNASGSSPRSPPSMSSTVSTIVMRDRRAPPLDVAGLASGPAQASTPRTAQAHAERSSYRVVLGHGRTS